MDESRKQFDEVYEQMKHDRFGSNEDWAWKFWQESRAAIEIELPPAVDGSNVPFAGNAWNAYRSDAVEAIRAAGIKVKE